MLNRTVIHIDMNAYFASVEQQMNPQLRGRPVAVCGRGRTVVATSSYEARRFGVKTGMSLYEAKKLCPSLIPVEGNHMKYIDTARKIHQICLDYSELIDIFSVDEVFIDVTPALSLYRDPKIIAEKIKKRIRGELGLTCSAGVAPGKLLAKLASEKEKPDGLVVIERKEVDCLLSETPVESICGIGRRTKKHLNALGIITLENLKNTDIQLLRHHFGFMANILKRMGAGLDSDSVTKYDESELIKSVGHSNTLPHDTYDLTVIHAFLLMLSERVGVRLRRYKMMGRTVSLYIRYGDFSGFSRHKTIENYVRTGKDIFNTAAIILKSILPLKKAVRLVGVNVSSLAKYQGQRYLFKNIEKSEKFEEAMDSVNNKYGEFVLRPLSFDIVKKFTNNTIDVPARVHGFSPELMRG